MKKIISIASCLLICTALVGCTTDTNIGGSETVINTTDNNATKFVVDWAPLARANPKINDELNDPANPYITSLAAVEVKVLANPELFNNKVEFISITGTYKDPETFVLTFFLVNKTDKAIKDIKMNIKITNTTTSEMVVDGQYDMTSNFLDILPANTAYGFTIGFPNIKKSEPNETILPASKMEGQYELEYTVIE